MRPEGYTEICWGVVRKAVQAAKMARAKAPRPQSPVLSRNRAEWPERMAKGRMACHELGALSSRRGLGRVSEIS